MTSPIDTDAPEAPEQEKPKLNLEVKVESPSTCERHVTVTVPRADIDRYIQDAFDDLKPKAEVPGFRPGRAPRKIVEARFKDQVSDQVKGSILMDSMSQVSDECDFSAISEPDFDFEAIDLPEDGPLTFEFDIEVRPEFDMPEWKGLELEQPAHAYSDDEVKKHTTAVLAKYGKIVSREHGPAEQDDLLEVSITFEHDGETLSSIESETLTLKPNLSFADGRLEGFDKIALGKKRGDKFDAKIKLSDGAANEELRGKEIDAKFEVLDVRSLEIPALDDQFLEKIGGFENSDELYDEVRQALERQFTYHQQQETRKQITAKLTANANWELPPELLKRQANREVERAVMELQASGFSNDVIRAHSNELRQNTKASTERALKEHFILERLAEEHELEATPEDFDAEIQLIAYQSDESPRRVRARMEKRGQMDTLRNQIIERRVIELITAEAKITEVPFDPKTEDTAAVEHSICGTLETDIPEAKHGGQDEALRTPADRT